MILPRHQRRRVDLIIAALIAVGALIAASIVYLGSDVRATTLMSAPAGTAPDVPTAATRVPQAVQEIWQLRTDPRYGAVATPYGTVVTADQHTVRGFDAANGTPLWSYARSNRALCAIGSGDTKSDGLDAWTGVHGVMTLFAKNGFCSQVTLLDPSDGDRLYQRTSPNQDPGQLFFGSPYVGWLGSDYLELWRHDLVTTIRYGNQPNPVNANGRHLGCTFSDAAVTADQLATIEHCDGTTNLVLNWPTPSDAPDKGDKGWDANHSEPKATIPLPGPTAVILALTADRAAVLVSEPSPAVIVYDAAGVEVSRTPTEVSPAEISRTAAAGITPATIYQNRRYTLVGTHLFAFSTETISVPAPPAKTGTSANDAGGAEDLPSDDAGSVESAAPTDTPATVEVDTPVLDWTTDALGLPTRIGDDMLVPVTGGLAVVGATDGTVSRTIPVDRGPHVGRVDVTAVGTVLVEVRGADMIGLGAAG